MAPPQDSSNHTRLVERRRNFADGASFSRASSSELLDTGELVGDTQTNNAVSEEPPPQREAPRAPLQAEGRPPTPLQAEGRPPTGAKWNFNLELVTPGTLLPLPPVAADLSILELLPSEELGGLIPEVVFRGMEKCIKHHRHDMVG